MKTDTQIIHDLLGKWLDITEAEISANPRFVDLDCDSLDVMELVMLVEDDLDINIDESQSGFQANSRIQDFIAAALNQKTRAVPVWALAA